ncbi:unnamed protein product, partial [Brassica rapa]
MVSELLCPLTNKWEVEKIRALLPQYEDTILKIKTSSTTSTDTLGVLVCKVDAAWDAGSGRCGIGGVYSEQATLALPSFSEAHNHVSSALMAEAIAVHRA